MQLLEYTNVRQWSCNAAELRDNQLVEKLTDYICAEFQVAKSRRSDLQLLLAEVIVNSIDHGILQLDSKLKKDPDGFEEYFNLRAKKLSQLTQGSVLVRVEHRDNEMIRITVQDSGNGFDVPKSYEQAEDDNLLSYGRGLLIIRNLCESVTHVGSGNCIVVDFSTAG